MNRAEKVEVVPSALTPIAKNIGDRADFRPDRNEVRITDEVTRRGLPTEGPEGFAARRAVRTELFPKRTAREDATIAGILGRPPQVRRGL